MVQSVHLSNSFLSFLFFILLESFSGHAESDSVYPDVVKLLHIASVLISNTKVPRKKLKKNLFAIVFLISFAMRVRWVPVVVAPALVLVVVAAFLRSLVVALVLVFRPALVASCAILLMLARWGAHPHTHPRTHIRTYTHTRAIIFRRAIFRL